jgi:hypothetical protein
MLSKWPTKSPHGLGFVRSRGSCIPSKFSIICHHHNYASQQIAKTEVGEPGWQRMFLNAWNKIHHQGKVREHEAQY